MTGSELAVANLHNGVDIYSILSLNLVKSLTYSIQNNTLYKVCIVNNVWVKMALLAGMTCAEVSSCR